MATAPRHDNRRLHLVQSERPPNRGPSTPRFHPLLLWLGILGGPVAFGIDRFAGAVLLSGRCVRSTGNAILLGLSSAETTMAAITILCALSAAAAGVLSWHIWRRTRRPNEDRSGESLRAIPFWAMGGVFLGGVFCVLILLTGGLAIGLSATCAS